MLGKVYHHVNGKKKSQFWPVNDDKKQTDPHRSTAVKEIAEEELEKLKLC